MEYQPFEFAEHTPEKFSTYCPTKDGFYLKDNAKYKYILDENEGQCILSQRSWADENGCYYDGNGKPAGWISISICQKQYKHYDLEQQIIKEGENKCYSNHVRQVNKDKISEPKKKAPRQDNIDQPDKLVKKQSHDAQNSKTGEDNKKQQRSNGKDEQNPLKEQKYIEKTQNIKKKYVPEKKQIAEISEKLNAYQQQSKADVPQQQEGKKRFNNQDRNGKRKREREAKQQLSDAPEQVLYVEKQSTDVKDSNDQVTEKPEHNTNNNEKKDRRQGKNIYYQFQEQKQEQKETPVQKSRPQEQQQEPKSREVVANHMNKLPTQNKTKNIAAVTIETKEQLESFIAQITQDFEQQQQSSKYIIILHNQKLKANAQQQQQHPVEQKVVQKQESDKKDDVIDKNTQVEVKQKDQMTEQQLQLTQSKKKVLVRPK